MRIGSIDGAGGGGHSPYGHRKRRGRRRRRRIPQVGESPVRSTRLQHATTISAAVVVAVVVAVVAGGGGGERHNMHLIIYEPLIHNGVAAIVEDLLKRKKISSAQIQVELNSI